MAGYALLWGALAVGATAGVILHAAPGPAVLTVAATLVAGLVMLSVLAVPNAGSPARGIPPAAASNQDHPTVWPYY